MVTTACASSTNEAQPAPLPSTSIAKYADTSVQLDYEHGTASLPTDKLDNGSPENNMRALHAIAASSDKCMVKQGFEAISGSVDWRPYSALEDRILGRWSVPYASAYGAERSPDSGPPSVDLVQYGVKFNKAYATCQDAAKEQLQPELMFLQSRNMISDIRSRAFQLATGSKDGKAAIAKWRQCGEDAGIVLDPKDGFPVEEYKHQGKRAEIEAYVTFAGCAQSTGAIQTIYDLRARYELALMDSQQERIASFEREQIGRAHV